LSPDRQLAGRDKLDREQIIEQLSEGDPMPRKLAERLLNAPRNFEEAANDPMSGLGHKQTFSDTLFNVRYWGLSGRSRAALRMSAYSQKRTFD
jgi:hypothetical protein